MRSTRRLVVSDRDITGGLLIPFVQFLLRRDLVHEMVFAHEFTHELQDQHVDLRKRIRGFPTDDDRVAAYQALVEGAATLAGVAYVSRRFDAVPRLPRRLHQKLAKEAPKLGPAFRQAPPALRESLLFPYAEGAEFTRALLRRKGWSGVVRAYRAPPLSTEEILHPAKYLEGSDPPLDFDLGAADRLPAQRWRLVEDNVLGEYLLGVLLGIDPRR